MYNRLILTCAALKLHRSCSWCYDDLWSRHHFPWAAGNEEGGSVNSRLHLVSLVWRLDGSPGSAIMDQFTLGSILSSIKSVVDVGPTACSVTSMHVRSIVNQNWFAQQVLVDQIHWAEWIWCICYLFCFKISYDRSFWTDSGYIWWTSSPRTQKVMTNTGSGSWSLHQPSNTAESLDQASADDQIIAFGCISGWWWCCTILSSLVKFSIGVMIRIWIQKSSSAWPILPRIWIWSMPLLGLQHCRPFTVRDPVGKTYNDMDNDMLQQSHIWLAREMDNIIWWLSQWFACILVLHLHEGHYALEVPQEVMQYGLLILICQVSNTSFFKKSMCHHFFVS